MVSDAFHVGEGWISEHYFTTDAPSRSFSARVLERRIVWDAESAAGRPSARSGFTAARQELEVSFGGLNVLLASDADRPDPAEVRTRATAVHDRVLAILELNQHGLTWDRDGAVIRVAQTGMTDRAPLAVVLAAPCGKLEEVLAKSPQPTESGDPATNASLFEPVRLDEDGPELTSAARLTSALFVSDDAPDLVLVLSGPWAVLAERERWAEGRYLAVNLQLACERNDTRRGGRDRPRADLPGGGFHRPGC